MNVSESEGSYHFIFKSQNECFMDGFLSKQCAPNPSEEHICFK